MERIQWHDCLATRDSGEESQARPSSVHRKVSNSLMVLLKYLWERPSASALKRNKREQQPRNKARRSVCENVSCCGRDG